MRYILVKAQVHVGTPNNTLSLLVFTRTGWAPWSEVEGKTNCTDPELCPVLSFGTRYRAWKLSLVHGGNVVPVDVDNPVGG